MSDCPKCNGAGHANVKIAGRRFRIECDACQGEGVVAWYDYLPPALRAEFAPAPIVTAGADPMPRETIWELESRDS